MSRQRRYRDKRLGTIKDQLQQSEADLLAVGGYLESLSEEERSEALGALHHAYQLGQSLGELQHVPLQPVIDPEGSVPLGSELRQHLDQARRLQADIVQLRNLTQQVFYERAKRAKRRRLRWWRRQRRSDTTPPQ